MKVSCLSTRFRYSLDLNSPAHDDQREAKPVVEKFLTVIGSKRSVVVCFALSTFFFFISAVNH